MAGSTSSSDTSISPSALARLAREGCVHGGLWDLSFRQVVAPAYEEIIGFEEATKAGIDVPAALP